MINDFLGIRKSYLSWRTTRLEAGPQESRRAFLGMALRLSAAAAIIPTGYGIYTLLQPTAHHATGINSPSAISAQAPLENDPKLGSLYQYLKGQTIITWPPAKFTVPLPAIEASKELAKIARQHGWNENNLAYAKETMGKEVAKIPFPIKVAFELNTNAADSVTNFSNHVLTKNEHYLTLVLNGRAPTAEVIGRYAKHEARHAKDIAYFRKAANDAFYTRQYGENDVFSYELYNQSVSDLVFQKADQLKMGSTRQERESLEVLGRKKEVAFSLAEMRVWATGDKELDREPFLYGFKQYIRETTGKETLDLKSFKMVYAGNLSGHPHYLNSLVKHLVISEHYGLDEISGFLKTIVDQWLNAPEADSARSPSDKKAYYDPLYKLHQLHWEVAEKYLMEDLK